MKKGKFGLLICGFVVTIIFSAVGIGLLASATVKEGWSEISIDSEYTYKSVFNLEDRTYNIGAKTYEASALLYYPDGTVKIFGDVNAEDSDAALRRYGTSYYQRNQYARNIENNICMHGGI